MKQDIPMHLGNQSVSLITKVYIWSIVLEPMLYFKIFERGFLPVHLTLSRFCQVMVILMLIARVCMNPKCMLPYRVRDNVKLFKKYFLLIFLSSILGLFTGSYVWIGGLQLHGSTVMQLIYNPQMRSAMEIVILLYQIGYFILLCPLLVKHRNAVVYLFKVILLLGGLHFILGFMDYFNVLPFGKLGRHFSDGRMVGARFHGIAGEPRDAMVFGFFFYALMLVRTAYFNKADHNSRWLFVIAISFILAHSFSGILGFGIGLLFYAMYTNKRHLVWYGTIGGLLLTALVFYDPRNFAYYKHFLSYLTNDHLYQSSISSVPPMLQGQFSNIYVMAMVYHDLVFYNWIQLLIGHGIGSSQFLLSRVYDTLQLTHAQIPRQLYETGLLGTLLFCSVARQIHTNAMNVMVKGMASKHFLAFCLLLGATMGHRSYCLFIYLGVVLAISQVMQNELSKENEPCPTG